jgi:hypothetical protein
MIYETVEALNGNKVTRIKSALFWWAGLACIVGAIYLFSDGIYGGAALITILAPCLLLYPLIRALFGGKDSIGAVVATVVVEEVMKNKLKNMGKDSEKKRKR